MSCSLEWWEYKPYTISWLYVAELDWELEHIDVVTAFLNHDLQETVYVSQPEGFEDKQHSHWVCKLKETLYGLKQAPKSSYDKIDKFLQDCGFKHTDFDSNLYLLYDKDDCILLVLYVRPFGHPKGGGREEPGKLLIPKRSR